MIRCGEIPTCIGPFVTGEKPNTLSYQFLNADGTVINLTGFSARYVYREKRGTSIDRAATITTPTNGTVTYAWVGDEFATPGHYVSEFWVGNAGTLKYASVLILFDVRSPVGAIPSV